MLVSGGSSPRMRGAHLTILFRVNVQRIIPAYAGSTNHYRQQTEDFRDHPRVCGEHFSHTLRLWSVSGSSPRMRGAHGLVGFLLCLLGIIPAYAGSTVRNTVISYLDKDHPRVCGEH